MPTLPQAAAGVTFVPPDGQTSFVVSSPSLLLGANGPIADVFLTTAYATLTSVQLTSLTNFIRGGGGLVTGGQGWSASNIATFPGNLLLGPLNVLEVSFWA